MKAERLTQILIALVFISMLLFLIIGKFLFATPKSVYLYIEYGETKVYNADGAHIDCTNEPVDGDMEIINIVGQNEFGYMVEVPYSDSFTFVNSESKKNKYGVRSNLDPTKGTEYIVSGLGIQKVTISPSGKVVIIGDNCSFEVFGNMKVNSLGSHGSVRLSGVAEDGAEIEFDKTSEIISFDGITSALMFMTIGGNIHANSIALPNPGCGTISISNLSDGIITIVDESGNSQTISIDTTTT